MPAARRCCRRSAPRRSKKAKLPPPLASSRTTARHAASSRCLASRPADGRHYPALRTMRRPLFRLAALRHCPLPAQTCASSCAGTRLSCPPRRHADAPLLLAARGSPAVFSGPFLRFGTHEGRRSAEGATSWSRTHESAERTSCEARTPCGAPPVLCGQRNGLRRAASCRLPGPRFSFRAVSALRILTPVPMSGGRVAMLGTGASPHPSANPSQEAVVPPGGSPAPPGSDGCEPLRAGAASRSMAASPARTPGFGQTFASLPLPGCSAIMTPHEDAPRRAGRE